MPRLHGIFHVCLVLFNTEGYQSSSQSLIADRPEVDSASFVERANPLPSAERYTSETLPDYNMAIHAIAALWCADVSWFLDGLDASWLLYWLDPQNEFRWEPQTLELWQAQSIIVFLLHVMSENTGSVGKRTIASGAIIGFANIYGGELSSHCFDRLLCETLMTVWASQIYQASDSPSKSS